MARHGARKNRQAQGEFNTSLALRLGDRQENTQLSPVRGKRCQSESDDDLSSTDSEEDSDLEDALDSDQDSDSSPSTAPTRHGPSQTERLAALMADRAFPALSRWMGSARYIRSPEHRMMPPRKRLRREGRRPRSVFVEAEDPDDPSTVLLLRVDGYYHLACPFSVRDPGRHESCVLAHDLRSIADVFRHLRRCHPSRFYCPTCGQLFDSDLPCDDHIRERACALRDFAPPRGASRAQLRRAVGDDDRHRREADRWRRLYEHVFPGTPRPPRGAAYLRRGMPLAVSMARDYWYAHGWGMMEDYLAEQSASDGEQLTEEGLWALHKLVERELIQRVVETARCDEELCQREADVEAGWEILKTEP